MQIFFKTDVGLVRNSNQDDCRYGMFSDTSAWAVVCDGMGGVNGGSVASVEAVEEISNKLKEGFRQDMSEDELTQVMKSAVSSANRKVYEMSCESEILRGMGTTVELAVIKDGVVHVVHAGDSRVYIVYNDRIEQLTTDHSLVQEMVIRGELTEEQARVHPSKNFITRALGVESALDLDYISRPFIQGNMLLMCTDGLTNYFAAGELLDIIQNTSHEELTEKLVSIAKERGGSDNITVAVISAE
ncbi:MAG: Stp1/IreP family PP2C-type Ser/Thr phosphatase [Lachnospiraceae bacterium]|nr:Stp1/IreP family PP2C-type Ser/Thr phosphatase [Lachnospiraceae bacterium]